MESLSHKEVKVVGIVREVKSKWERRCALTPKEVKELTADGTIKVLVQPSPSRCYTDEEFIEAGA
jgi:alpha-aminoadipic semialdehyde synthase